MPDVQEVFRLATNKVKPDPNALERQQKRQRSSTRTTRARAYLVVAAVIAAIAVGALAITRTADSGDPTPGGSTPPTTLSFVTALPAGADGQTPAIVDLEGHQTGKVTGLPVDAFAPSVSADGTTIAFIAAPSGLGYNQIGVVGSDGSDPHFVSTPHVIVANTLAISPDASRVAFEGYTSGNSDIYVVGVDGTGLRQLTTDPATDQFPQWSPDGTTIVYDNAGAREQSDPQFSKTAEIFTVPADGGAPTRLTHNNWTDAAPSYSPDGKTIVDQSAQDFSMMDADGSNERRFPIGMGGFTPRWSPDGKTIAFSYYKDVANRPAVQLGDQYGADRPLVIVALADVASGDVTRLTKVGMATDLNTPQWLDKGHLLIMRVSTKG